MQTSANLIYGIGKRKKHNLKINYDINDRLRCAYGEIRGGKK